MAKLFKRKLRDGKDSPRWYTKYRDESGKLRQRVLFTDKAASQRRADDLERDASKRAAGVITPDMDHAGRPISEHVADYLAELKASVDDKHYRVTEFTMKKLLALTGWKRLCDINPGSVRRSVGALKLGDGKGKVAALSYKNKFVTRAKAFVNWLVDESRIAVNVLAKLEKFKKGVVRRDRRALAPDEVAALLGATTPPHRARVYEFALLTGLRRNELAKLCYSHLRLNAPRPFIQLWKQGKTRAEPLPLHPRLVALLRADGDRRPSEKVLQVPDVKTVKKDMRRAGITLVDADGKVVDLHAMRHTFSTEVCRQEPNQKKVQKLTRHESAAVFSKYVHLALGEMSDVLERVTYGTIPAAVIQANGTDGCGPPVVQSGVVSGHFVSQPVTLGRGLDAQASHANHSGKQALSASGLNETHPAAIVPNMRPSTQAD